MNASSVLNMEKALCRDRKELHMISRSLNVSKVLQIFFLSFFLAVWKWNNDIITQDP